jgi:putative intracellular protease/amidase
MKKALLLSLMLIMAIGLSYVSLEVIRAQTPAANAPRAETKVKSSVRNLAIFIFNGVQIIDYTGPFEVFGQAHDEHDRLFNVYTVAEKADPVTTNMGMTVVPKYTFDNMPRADVLLLPGGNVGPQLENLKVIKWVLDSSSKAEYVMSVCNGAFYLGKAGLLDGLTATTYYGLIDELKVLAPKARIVSDQRFVDNGKIITTAGLSSGIDGALHLVEKIAGRPMAQAIALNLEYNWQPDLNYARASFADMNLIRVIGRDGFKLPDNAGIKLLGQRGGRDDWEKNWQVHFDASAPELLKVIDTQLAEKWTKVPVENASSSTRTNWKFTDDQGKAWNGVSSVQPISGEDRTFKLTIKLVRADVSAKLSDN